MNDEEYQLHS